MKNIILVIILCAGVAGIWAKQTDRQLINNVPSSSSTATSSSSTATSSSSTATSDAPVISKTPAIVKKTSTSTQKTNQSTSLPPISQAYQNKQSNIQILSSGVIVAILSDENKGSKHQRFILKVADDHTVLIAHNIDLAPRLPQLQKGALVEFYGEYEWNDKGGVIHWTHRDPQGNHPHGWLKYNGITYQ